MGFLIVTTLVYIRFFSATTVRVHKIDKLWLCAGDGWVDARSVSLSLAAGKKIDVTKITDVA
jgi:hypothetical protein